MVGMPDYDAYVTHMQTTHPDKPVMTLRGVFPRAAGGEVWIGGGEVLLS